MAELTQAQENLFQFLKSRPFSFKFVTRVPLNFLLFYAVPILVLASTQVELPQTLLNLLPPLAWLTASIYALGAVVVSLIFAFFMWMYGSAKSGDPTGARIPKEKNNSFCSTAKMFCHSNFFLFRRAMAGLASTFFLWSSAYYLTGALYFISMLVSTTVFLCARSLTKTFVSEQPEEEVLRLLGSPWKKKPEIVKLVAVAGGS